MGVALVCDVADVGFGLVCVALGLDVFVCVTVSAVILCSALDGTLFASFLSPCAIILARISRP